MERHRRYSVDSRLGVDRWDSDDDATDRHCGETSDTGTERGDGVDHETKFSVHDSDPETSCNRRSDKSGQFSKNRAQSGLESGYGSNRHWNQHSRSNYDAQRPNPRNQERSNHRAGHSAYDHRAQDENNRFNGQSVRNQSWTEQNRSYNRNYGQNGRSRSNYNQQGAYGNRGIDYNSDSSGYNSSRSNQNWGYSKPRYNHQASRDYSGYHNNQSYSYNSHNQRDYRDYRHEDRPGHSRTDYSFDPKTQRWHGHYNSHYDELRYYDGGYGYSPQYQCQWSPTHAQRYLREDGPSRNYDGYYVDRRNVGYNREQRYPRVVSASEHNEQRTAANSNLLIDYETPYEAPVEREESRTPRHERKIFCGGISKKVTEDDLLRHFDRYGPVQDVVIPRDRGSETHRHYAYVLFVEKDCIREILDPNYCHILCGQEFQVKPVEPLANKIIAEKARVEREDDAKWEYKKVNMFQSKKLGPKQPEVKEEEQDEEDDEEQKVVVKEEPPIVVNTTKYKEPLPKKEIAFNSFRLAQIQLGMIEEEVRKADDRNGAL